MKSILIKKGFTNSGDPAKQVMYLVGDKPETIALVIHKSVLTADPDYKKMNFDAIREFRGKTYYHQVFVIRLNTFHEVFQWLSGLSTIKGQGIKRIREE